MKVRDFKKILFSNPKLDFKYLKEPGRSGRVDLWKNSVNQLPLIVVLVSDKYGSLTLCTDASETTNSHGTVKTKGLHTLNPVSAYDFVRWFETNYANEFQLLRFKMEGKIYNKVKKISYDQQSGNIDIYLKDN